MVTSSNVAAYYVHELYNLKKNHKNIASDPVTNFDISLDCLSRDENTQAGGGELTSCDLV